MRKLALIVAVALLPSLGACGAQLQTLRADLAIVTSARVSPKAVVVARKTFNLLEGMATDYLDLPRCHGTNQICRTAAISRKVEAAIEKGQAARATLVAFYRAHPGELGPQGAYDALIASIATLKGLISKNAGAMQ